MTTENMYPVRTGRALPKALQEVREPSSLRERALNLIELAQHPRLLPSGAGMVHEDSKTADREAQLALAAAMLDLADALRSSGSA